MNPQGQVRVAADGAVAGLARVTLSHPGKLNAMSRAMWRQLREVFEQLQREPRWRCVLLEGEGEAFCAGGDIAEYPSFRFDQAQLRHFHEVEVWGGLRAVLDCDLPVVAAIRGACMGAGVEIAACCDIRLAGEGARFGAPIARLGFPMAPREAQLVARAAGEATAREMLLEAAVLEAGEMKQRGFLQHVVPDAQLGERALASAARIAALAPQAARLNKRTLRMLATGDLEPDRPPARIPLGQAATESIAGSYAYADSAEHREGIAAFLAKRRPAF